MFEELKKKKELIAELEKELSSPELLSDRNKYKEKSKEYSDLKELMTEYDKYLLLIDEKASLEKIIVEED
ncbi:MAG: PCRF domain-containing protein, partial [Candidatus Omnitrophica bacterium]|nr:PCRF domain-containing protein [Candidatus Omnitrophota bacterium]